MHAQRRRRTLGIAKDIVRISWYVEPPIARHSLVALSHPCSYFSFLSFKIAQAEDSKNGAAASGEKPAEGERRGTITVKARLSRLPVVKAVNQLGAEGAKRATVRIVQEASVMDTVFRPGEKMTEQERMENIRAHVAKCHLHFMQWFLVTLGVGALVAVLSIVFWSMMA